MSEIRYEVRDQVASVLLDAPQRRNALTPEMADELVEVFDAVDHDESIGAVVISGSKAAFCAGMDLQALAPVLEDPLREDNYQAIERIYRGFLRVQELKAPVIAAVRGAVVGAGVNLALAADVRIVAEDAQFISGFVSRGLHPGGGHFALVAEAANREVATAFAIFGEKISGARVVELGLAWQALADPDVEERAHQLARDVARDPELARRAIATLRATTEGSTVSRAVAVQAERAAQLWSQRRAGKATNAT